MHCGWSHRWVIGWGLAVERAKEAVAQARIRRLAKFSVAANVSSKVKSFPGRPRSWTATELDAELERLERRKPDPTGPP